MITQEDYEWLFRRLPVMSTLIAADGACLDVNDTMLERLGYTREDMVGHRPEEFMTPESAARVTSELRPALRRRGKLEDKYISFVTAGGDVVDCITNALVEYDRSGEFLRTVGMYMEVSDQARANFKYRTLYRSTPAMLHTVDGDGLLVTVTDHWLAKLGYRRKDVLGRPVTDFMSEADQKKYADGRLQELIAAGDFNNVERQMVRKDGTTIDLVMSAIANRDESGEVDRMLVASKDVTERNRAERELRRALAENAKLRKELERERDYLREEVNVALNFGPIVGTSTALKRMLKRVEAVAETPASVLLLGESGVGKELVARAIHARSPRADGPLVKVNCASIPKELFESEFFGHVKGAFTGAHRDRVGRFQLADGGTIFLDEVGEIPMELQGKLLRVLQESEFERVGDDVTRYVDVRIVAATNRNLEKLMVEGNFREDLFYRLSVFPIDVPPLRQRGGDIVQLAQHFLEQTCKDFGREPMTLTRSQAADLKAYDWPGNVRELKNVIERAVILSPGQVLRLDLSMPGARPEPVIVASSEPVRTDILTDNEMRAFQKGNIVKALERAAWKVSGKGGAAELLGVRPTTLADRIRTHGIKRPTR
ncbi:MAG: sigma 54-interacting transcriptional regulator [Gammaproteobacteria bacterium]|nr:sigma 54-interacting transcriptional regulator [Gammaproteobacteria bacterium]MBT8093547.1 sigma 54-interacting transcriptional regulator [Gammaproteobacteria bacterium]NNF49380.1 sigma 54-interacting transcriptional regulator [Woeseiaceae bacterium]NNL62582.1 sigma 54-interacting transcriptional regulator [Woeseiaceae bacterium]